MKTEKNPYSINFGQIPDELVMRMQPVITVKESFVHDNPKQQIYMITGIRGSGKTVFLAETAGRIAEENNWTVVDLNAEGDLLGELQEKLEKDDTLLKMIGSVSVSAAGISVAAGTSKSESSAGIRIEKVLKTMKKHGRKLLITLDEASNTPQTRLLVSEFQIWLRHDLPVYLLMTGLYKNISSLQDDKNLTFLYRAPKIMMEPLNIGAMAQNYGQNLPVKASEALEMARITCGYAFAFQVLGSMTWEEKGDYKKALPRFRQCLEEYSYEKIWSELSAKDQDILVAIAENLEEGEKEIEVGVLRQQLGMSSNLFNQYRKRLLRQGIIETTKYGYISFALPEFSRFIMENS